MALKTINDAILASIANAIRSKLNVATTYKPNQMAAAIGSIETPNLDTLDVTENGTYTPESPYNGFSEVDVSVTPSFGPSDEGKVVSEGQLVAQTSKNIGSNGTHDTTLNNQVVVSVTPNLQEKTVTQNGNVLPDSGYDGLSKVVVNVSGGGGGGGDPDAIFEIKDSKLVKGTCIFKLQLTAGYQSLSLGSANSYIKAALGSGYYNDVTIEVDVKSMNLTSGTHRRFIMRTDDRGLIYRSTGVWALYSGSWEDSTETDGSYFDDSTVKVYIDSNKKWHIYKDGVLWWEPQTAYSPSSGDYYVGASSNGLYPTTEITGIRIYSGFHQ